MAYDREYNYTSIGNYQPRGLKYTPIGDKVRESILASIDQYNKTATFNKTMQEGFSKIPLAAEESEWAQGLLNDAKNRIKANPRDLTGAMQIGDELLNNPELLGKSKYYQQREQTRERLNNNRNLDATTREWIWHENEYNPQLIKDGDKVVGVKDFTLKREPFDTIHWNDVVGDILKNANASSTRTSWNKSYYHNGSGGGSEGHNELLSLPPGKLSEACKQWVQDNYDRVAQQWEVDKYSYEKDKARFEQMDPNDPEWDVLRQRVNLAQKYFEVEQTRGNLEKYVEDKVSSSNAYIQAAAYSRSDKGSGSSGVKNDQSSGNGNEPRNFEEITYDANGNRIGSRQINYNPERSVRSE